MFATDTITFDKKTDIQEGVGDTENNSEVLPEEGASVIGYYQRIINYASEASTIIEFELKKDNTVTYVIGAANTSNYTDVSVVMEYSGTYLVREDEVILSITSTDSECVDGKYACLDIITLSKENDVMLVDSLGEYYKKDSLLLIK